MLRQLLHTRVLLASSNGIIQFVLVMIPSFILNSLIVASYIRCKFVRTPLNLLFACFSGMSIVSHIFVCLISFIGLPIGLFREDCVVSDSSAFVRGFFILTLAPLTVSCIAVAQCLIVSSGWNSVTYRSVVSTLVVVWTYAFILRFILYIIDVSTVDIKTPFCASVSPEEMRKKFVLRIARNVVSAVLIDVPTLIVVIVSTVTSCVRYQKRVIRKEERLQRKMLLLPILFSLFLFFTTFSTRFVFLLRPLFLFNSSLRIRFLSTVPYITSINEFLTITNSPLFAALLIYLNTAYRKGIKEILSASRKAMCKRRNRVHPDVTPSGTNLKVDVSSSSENDRVEVGVSENNVLL